MPSLRVPIRFALTSLAAGVLLTNGCVPPNAPPTYANATPRQYCPGDSVLAEYQALANRACVPHSGIDCAAIMPRVTIASDSAALPAETVTAFGWSRTFRPTEAAVSVRFTATPETLIFPSLDANGREILLSGDLRPVTIPLRRIDGEIAQTLTHNGMCSGRMPVHAPAQLPGGPDTSSGLIAQRICNVNEIPIVIDVSGSSPSASASGTVAPHACLALGFPPFGLVTVRPATITPGEPCGSIETAEPPQTLTTQVYLSCG